MSFDKLAPHYRWMEWILAGSKLQKCRTAFLHRIPAPNHVLLVGEGNGRFLLELVRTYPQTHITCLDASARMLEESRTRLRTAGFNTDRVEFIHTEILEWSAPRDKFDLVVSHFFLDCFDESQLEQIVPRLAASTTSSSVWLLSDFNQPATGLMGWRARQILRVMYWYFRWGTGLSASRLVVPDPFLKKQGYRIQERRVSEWGLLHSDLWIRSG